MSLTIINCIISLILFLVHCFANYQLIGLLKVCVKRILRNETYIERCNIGLFEEKLGYNEIEYKPFVFYSRGSKLNNWKEWMGNSILTWVLPLKVNTSIGLCKINKDDLQLAIDTDKRLLDKHIREYREQGFSERAMENIIKGREEEMSKI